jgi:hypothetical protein
VLWAGRPRRRDDTAYVLGDVVTVATAPALNAARLFACVTAGRSAAAEPADYGTAPDGATIQDGAAAFRAIRVAFNSNPLVVVVSSFPAGRAVNYGQDNHIAISTRSGTYPIPVQARPMGFVLDLDETDVPNDVDIDTCRTIAHEIGHSFGWGTNISRGPTATSRALRTTSITISTCRPKPTPRSTVRSMLCASGGTGTASARRPSSAPRSRRSLLARTRSRSFPVRPGNSTRTTRSCFATVCRASSWAPPMS